MNNNNTINSNFVIESEILVKYLGSDPTVQIPNGVTKIGTSAFSNSNVEEIVFSRSLQVIEECAFENCKKLEFVKLPEGLIKIGTHAFYGCSALKCVYVPSSILILEENAFSGCPSDFFLISAKGSEAEKIATAKLLGFKEGSSQTVDKFKGLNQKRKELTTKTFDIFGEQITCSNSLPLYDKIVNRYKISNQKFIDKIKNFLPRDLDGVTNGNMQKIIDDQTAQVLHFLQEEGVVIEKSHATLAISSDVVNLCNNMGFVLKKYKIIKESISKNIEEKVVDLKHEIDSKVTGLPYGVIGNTMDLLIYDIGELEAKARQRGQATAIAERKLSSFQSQQWIQGNEIYDAELKKQMPIICENAENICENLKQWELSILSKSGLLDMEFIKSLDYKKSMELFNSTEDRERDEGIILALSLKKYPYNISAIAKAVAKKYSSQGLLDLVEFLGISNEVAECAKEERAKYISKLKDTLSSKPSTNLMVEFYCEIKGNLDGDEKKDLLSKIANRISTQVSHLSNTSAENDIQNIKEYVEQKLISIFTPNQWDLFINEGIHPRDFITSIPFENCSTYESMLLYIISTLDRRKKETELNFSRAKEQLESAKTIKEYEETKKLFAKLNGYNDSLKIIEEIDKTILDLQYEEIVSELGKSKKREKLNVAKVKLNALENHAPSKKKLAEVDLLLKKDTKNKIIIGLISSVLVIAIFVVLFTVIIPNSKYNDAIALMNDGKYTGAIIIFEELDGYEDSLQKIEEIHSSGKLHARKLAEEGKYQEAADLSNKYGLSEDAEHYYKISNGEYWRLCEHFDFKEIVLPDNITTIGESAFLNCSNLTKITIPNNVTSIGKSAFSGCSRLTNITIPNNVTSIGEYAFSGCSSLTSITLPNNVTYIGESAFSGCSRLTNITIPNNVTSIGEYAFSGCSSLTSITLPNNVTRISKSTFADCSSLTNIEIPNSVEIIDEAAFSGCSSLTKMTIPENVTKISKDVLNGCNNLQELTIPFTGLSVDSIEYEAHVGYIFGYDYDSGRYSPTGHFYTTSGSSYLTNYNCYTYNIPKSLKNVIITNSKTIKAFAFQNCNTLEGVELYDGTTTIEDNAFKGCSKLESLILPDTINSIYLDIFTTLPNLNYTEYNNAYYFGSSNNLYMFLVKAKDNSITTCTIHSNTKFIANDAFLDCTNLKNIFLPTGLICIGHSAFEGCTSITEIVIPDSVTMLGVAAFQDCTALRSVKIGCGVTNIKTSTFDGCENISTLIIPVSVTEIGGWAFDYAGRDNLSYVYYGGTSQQWSNIVIDRWGAVSSIFADEYMRPSPLYYYSETKPTTTGNYWHYVDGVPTIW